MAEPVPSVPSTPSAPPVPPSDVANGSATRERQSAPEMRTGARSGSLGQTARAVFWSFFGVRKRRDYEADASNLNPVHVIIMGVVGAMVFVAILIVIVNLVVR